MTPAFSFGLGLGPRSERRNMVRSWGTLSRVVRGVFCLWVMAGFACGDDDGHVAPDSSPSSPRSRDAGAAVQDASTGSKPSQQTDAGMPAAKRSFPSARAMLTAVQDDAADGGVPLRAEASFSERRQKSR